MGAARDHLNQARERLHQKLSVKALYVCGSNDPVPVTVRVHEKQKDIGDMPGGFAARAEMVTCLILLNAEFTTPPVKGAYVSIAADEAYTLAVVDPVHGVTREVEVTRLTPARITDLALPLPESE